jgi:hypothetical protein
MKSVKYTLECSVAYKVEDMHIDMISFRSRSKESYVQQNLDASVYSCINRVYLTTLIVKEWK